MEETLAVQMACTHTAAIGRLARRALGALRHIVPAGRRTVSGRVGLATLALFTLAVGNGHAQFLFWPNYRPTWNHYAPFGLKHKHSRKPPAPIEEERSNNEPKGPLQIIISIADQRVSLYDNGTLVARSSVSTGVPGHPTPRGIFSVIAKQRWHRSNIYSAAPMPYMQRITWSGIALHEGVVPGRPASHGCIRLTHDFAIRLWHLTKRGTRVIIARDEVRPVEVASPHLFVPKPKMAVESPGIPPDGVAEDSGEVVQTTAAGAVARLGAAKKEGSVQVSDAAPPRTAPRKAGQISIFVSRKEGRLFVRQGFAPLFNVPITIQNPERPLGTHIFTAMEFTGEDSAVRWTVVSLPEEPSSKFGERRKADGQLHRKEPDQLITRPIAWIPTPELAAAALDRIDIPKSAIDRISDLLSPGSSLIVSDQGISNDTGDYTDFIVLSP
jgi:L,D-transpeptidase catalytic domain